MKYFCKALSSCCFQLWFIQIPGVFAYFRTWYLSRASKTLARLRCHHFINFHWTAFSFVSYKYLISLEGDGNSEKDTCSQSKMATALGHVVDQDRIPGNPQGNLKLKLIQLWREPRSTLDSWQPPKIPEIELNWKSQKRKKAWSE